MSVLKSEKATFRTVCVPGARALLAANLKRDVQKTVETMFRSEKFNAVGKCRQGKVGKLRESLEFLVAMQMKETMLLTILLSYN